MVEARSGDGGALETGSVRVAMAFLCAMRNLRTQSLRDAFGWPKIGWKSLDCKNNNACTTVAYIGLEMRNNTRADEQTFWRIQLCISLSIDVVVDFYRAHAEQSRGAAGAHRLRQEWSGNALVDSVSVCRSRWQQACSESEQLVGWVKGTSKWKVVNPQRMRRPVEKRERRIGEGLPSPHELARVSHGYEQRASRVHPILPGKVWFKNDSKLYNTEKGEGSLDNQRRLSPFRRTAGEATLPLKLSTSNPNLRDSYGEAVVLVASDRHSTVLLRFRKAKLESKGHAKKAKAVRCMICVSYQGRFHLNNFHLLNFPDQCKGPFDSAVCFAEPVRSPRINWMIDGTLEPNTVVMVSSNYAREILSSLDREVELDSLSRKTGSKAGIVNNMDIQEWDAPADKYLEVIYDVTSVLGAKPALKETLQVEIGLPGNRDVLTIGSIGRLEEKKGSEFLNEAVRNILKNDVQLIMVQMVRETNLMCCLRCCGDFTLQTMKQTDMQASQGQLMQMYLPKVCQAWRMGVTICLEAEGKIEGSTVEELYTLKQLKEEFERWHPVDFLVVGKDWRQNYFTLCIYKYTAVYSKGKGPKALGGKSLTTLNLEKRPKSTGRSQTLRQVAEESPEDAARCVLVDATEDANFVFEMAYATILQEVCVAKSLRIEGLKLFIELICEAPILMALHIVTHPLQDGDIYEQSDGDGMVEQLTGSKERVDAQKRDAELVKKDGKRGNLPTVLIRMQDAIAWLREASKWSKRQKGSNSLASVDAPWYGVPVNKHQIMSEQLGCKEVVTLNNLKCMQKAPQRMMREALLAVCHLRWVKIRSLMEDYDRSTKLWGSVIQNVCACKENPGGDSVLTHPFRPNPCHN